MSDENTVPNVTLYHNVKSCKRGTVSNFVGYGVNNECNIVDPAFIENCISVNKKLLFSPEFLEKAEMNSNKNHKLFYQMQQLLNNNNKKSIDEIQIHSIQRVVVKVTNDKGKSQTL